MSDAAGSITVRVPLTNRRRPGRKTVVTPVRDGGEEALPTRADLALVNALARAFRYRRLLDEGRYASISEMAAAEKLDRGYLGRVLQLTLLAPDIVEAILDGRQAGGLTLSSLSVRIPTMPAGASDRSQPPVLSGCFPSEHAPIGAIPVGMGTTT